MRLGQLKVVFINIFSYLNVYIKKSGNSMILIHELIFSVMMFDLKNTLLCQNYVESNIRQ